MLVSSSCSRNSEAKASEFLEQLEEVLLSCDEHMSHMGKCCANAWSFVRDPPTTISNERIHLLADLERISYW